MFLSVVIPAYNEEKRLPETLKKVRDYFDQKNITYEVIVVNDGSKDQTAVITSEWINQKSKMKNQNEKEKIKNFWLIDNKVNRGKGAVVKQGMLKAKGEWRLFMDSDSSTDIYEIEKLLKYISNYEVIIGSRYLDKDSIKIKQPFSRRMISRAGNILVRMLLGIKSADTQCGFKLFSKKAAEEIFTKQTIERWGFDVEILAIAIKLGYKIKEVPVDWYDAEGSQVKKGAALRTLKELFEIKWNSIIGKYNK